MRIAQCNVEKLQELKLHCMIDTLVVETIATHLINLRKLQLNSCCTIVNQTNLCLIFTNLVLLTHLSVTQELKPPFVVPDLALNELASINNLPQLRHVFLHGMGNYWANINLERVATLENLQSIYLSVNHVSVNTKNL